jgi:2'-hydroxyisoflavone reductase
MPEPRSTRRTFLASSSAALAAAAIPQSNQAQSNRPEPRSEQATRPAPATEPAKKKILVLGGTEFPRPGRRQRGTRQRPRSDAVQPRQDQPGPLSRNVEKLHGQRRRPRPGKPNDPAQDLKALQGRKWDAVVDTSAYFTGEVEDMGKVLAGNVGQYVFISSLSVYKSLETGQHAVDEQSPLCECADKYTQDLGPNFENYGALKRYCEDAAEAAFPGKATLVRPGYIVGPGDPTDRFTYWPARFLRGGECLAPGPQDNDLQFVDVRDLGDWIVHLIEQGTMGPFNAVGFDGSISVAEFLHTGKGTVNHTCSFTWVDDAFLEANQVSAWGDMGCWTPKAKNGHTNNARAIAAGAKYRPIAETIRDTAAWVKNERGDKPWRAGLTAERETELLAKWKAR